jgi:hypothetical protein
VKTRRAILSSVRIVRTKVLVTMKGTLILKQPAGTKLIPCCLPDIPVQEARTHTHKLIFSDPSEGNGNRAMCGAKHNKCIVSLHDAVHSLFGPKRERLLLPTSALRNTVLRVNIHAASITTQPSYACTRA